MKSKNVHRGVLSDETHALHRNTYRLFCLLAGVLLPGFGLIYNFTDPSAVDPMLVRFGFGLFTLALLSLSYMSDWVEKNFIRLVQALFYVLTAYIVGLTVLNGFSPNYALGALFTLTAIAVAFSMGLKRFRPLVLYLCSAVAMCVTAVWLTANPSVSPAILSISVVSTALVIYVAARAKVSAEETTAATEKRYEMLVDSASDAIFIADAADDLLIEANRKAQELIGCSLDEIRRMRPKELFPLEDRARHWALFKDHIYEGKPLEEDFELVTSSGARIPVDVSVSLTQVGERSLIQGIFRDATKRHQHEEKLVEAKEQAEELLKLKTSFLNNMSHELRTPLTSILGFAEVLTEQSEGEQKEFSQHVARSARRLQNTLDSVLDLAQLESGKANLTLQKINLAEEVASTVDLLESLAAQKDLLLETLVSSPSTCVRADEAFIHRIVNNLVGNAIKFTSEGQVVVEVGRRQEKVFLRVSDTGVGIAPDFQGHLFDEFRQESTGLSRTHEGNGLGLAITRRLVDLLGGSIDVESRKGIGSTFTVWLSPAAGEEPSPASSGSPPSGDSGSEELASHSVAVADILEAAPEERRLKVLVLEDNHATQELLEYRLSGLCDVEKASAPREALRLARGTAFDAVLLDIHLGADMNGVDVLHALRAMPLYHNVPAIALTAHALPADRERFLKEGFNLHLPKPFTTGQLSHALGKLVWPAVPPAVS